MLTMDEVYMILGRDQASIQGMENIICGNFKLYTSFINAGRKLLLAHNNFVSVFHLTKSMWTEHYKFDD